MRRSPAAAGGALVPRLAEGDLLPPPDRRPFAAAHGMEGLYRDRARRLLRFFARRTDPQDAHDLVQESFARFADAGVSFEGTIDEPAAYLQQIATNLLRSRAREALRRSMARHVSDDEVPLSAPDPLTLLETRDMLARVQTALAKLGPETRAIFLAHRVEGLRYGEIAERRGLSVKGVEWHMSKAIARLDRTLNGR